MNQKETDIEQLMLERLAGVIEPEDENQLVELLNSDADAREHWETLKRSFETPSSSMAVTDTDPEKAWRDVKKGIARRRQARTRNKFKLKIAAIITVPILLAGIFIYIAKKPGTRIASSTIEDSIRLVLNQKRTINISALNSLATSRDLSGVRIEANQDSLSYVSLDSKSSHNLNTLIVPKKASYKITLDDGTQVWLNSMTQLTFPFSFSNGQREVWVSGEAYFKVTKNPHLPFIVHTPLTDIKVLGTEFNVNAYDSVRVVTALVEGRVDTKADKKTLTLKPGYEAVYTKGDDFQVSSFDKTSKLAWMQGVYYFQNATLKDIASIVNRWYGDSVVFNNQNSTVRHFSGAMFKNRPLSEFLDNLSLAANIHYYPRNGKIYISMP